MHGVRLRAVISFGGLDGNDHAINTNMCEKPTLMSWGDCSHANSFSGVNRCLAITTDPFEGWKIESHLVVATKIYQKHHLPASRTEMITVLSSWIYYLNINGATLCFELASKSQCSNSRYANGRYSSCAHCRNVEAFVVKGGRKIRQLAKLGARLPV